MVSSKNYVVIVPLLACYVGGFFDSGGVLLVSADDYDMFRDPATLRHWGRPLQSLLVTMYAFAVLLVLLEDVFFKPIFHSLLPKGAVSGQQMCVMARYASDGAAMLVFSYLGYAGLNDMGGWDTFWTASSFAKMNSFNALGLQLCSLQIAYELKSVCDVIHYGDGALFLAHHLCASSLAAFAFAPYCLVYSTFFLGISEVSTFVLCLLVNFDDERGITYFSANPNFLSVKQFLGVLFAALFIAYRVVAWPCVSYHFMLDSWFLLENNLAHSPGVVKYFMGVNGFLTAVQIFWLGEIMGHAVKLFQPLSKQQKTKTLAAHHEEDIGTSSPPGRRKSSRITKTRY